jgi:hypothetical protein
MPILKKGEWRCYACADGWCINEAAAERCWYCNADQDGVTPEDAIANGDLALCSRLLTSPGPVN